MNLSAKDRFLEKLRTSLESGSFVKMTLGGPASCEGPRKLLFRPVLIRGEAQCSVVSRFATSDETKNYPHAKAVSIVQAKLGADFRSANLFTETEEAQWELAGTKERLRVTPIALQRATLEHDRTKSRRVSARAAFLNELGITDSAGKVRERMGDKFRQIERFVDLLSSAYRESELPARPADSALALYDMGAGKGYLTFAAADYFERVEKTVAEVTGIEARQDLVTLCNGVAERCGFGRLKFVCSRIGEFPLPRIDILVALHACDTATDDALAAGIRAGARILLAAPCCHKEARPQVDRADRSDAGGPLRDILRHGLFAERHAEMATDALRALLLERAGYRVRVAEFVAAEHTAKNVMLIATRRSGEMSEKLRTSFDERISALKSFYGIGQHHLEQLLLTH